MNPNAETQQSVDALPVFQPPATFGEVWDANWTAAGLSTPFGVGAPRRQAVNELSDAYSRVTGRDPFADAAAAGTPIALPGMGPGVVATAPFLEGNSSRGLANSADARDLGNAIGTLADRLPDAQKTQLGPFLDVDGRAANIAQKAEQDAAAVNQRAYGLSGVGASYVAGLARGLADPTTLLGAFAGGPEAGALIPMLGREFAVNAGFGAVQHELVTPEREQLGLQSGSLVGDALESGTFGAGLGLLLRGAGWTLRQAMARGETGEAAPAGFRPNPTPPPDLHAEAGALAPEDFEAAARQQDRDTAIDAQAPVQTMPGRIEAGEATDAAAARIESGEGATLAEGGPSRYPDAFELAERGNLTPEALEGLADQAKQDTLDRQNAALGENADPWRKLQRQSDAAWSSGYKDVEAREFDRQQGQIEEALTPQQMKLLESADQIPDHRDFRSLARDLRAADASRGDRVHVVSKYLKDIPNFPTLAKLNGSGRDAVAVLDYAMRAEEAEGGSAAQLLKDAFGARRSAYGGGADADELVQGKMADVAKLLGQASEPTARSAATAFSIEFRGKSYSGARRIQAAMAAARDTGISVDRVWDEVTPERLEGAERAGQGARPAAPVKPADEAAAAAGKPLADATPGEGLAPQRADVERALEAAGGDARIQAPEGEASAREQLGLVDEFKAAAKELASCIISFGADE